ncbi:MAG: acyl-CoA thioesterase [Gemmatales bacterium]|nr:acyl-CoA thioesterase [Gemmatales bacterium]MDW8221773.1 hotdog domain-containing protein [Gemmatales bacterium]
MENRYLALKTVMMPRDTNPHGTIFGGVLLSQIDQAGANGAQWEIARRGVRVPLLVTVAVNRVEFHEPVYVGDVVSYWTQLVRIGRTSITIHVDVEVERDGKVVKVTEADVVYVAIAETPEGRRPVPILPESEASGGVQT